MNALPPVAINDILRYWRNSLADEDLMGLDGKDSPVRTTMDAVRADNLDENSVKLLQRAWDEHKNRAARDQTTADLTDAYKGAVPVVILARGFAPRHEHGKAVGAKAAGAAFYTLCIPAVLSPSGSFSFTADSLPWIGREYLLPNEEADASIPMVGELEAFDGWLNENPLGVAPWAELIQWCDGMWDHVAGDRVPEGFVALGDVRIDIAKSVRNAGRQICQLYDALLAEEKPPTLLNRLCRGRADHMVADVALRLRQLAAPRGTMGMAYGLADSQADAVAAYSTLGHGEVLAVNGPPGTGKTTLLQSIIASEVVARAVAGGEPAVIVGASTNNQAVTNINKSLNEVLRENPASALFTWARRWVPDAETYGLYLPTNDRAEEAASKGFAVALKNGNEWGGFPEREKDPAYLTRARLLWLDGYLETYGGEPATVEEGVKALRADLAGIVAEMHGLQGVLQGFATIDQWWRATAGEMAPRAFIDREDAELTAAVTRAVNLQQEVAKAVEVARSAQAVLVADTTEEARRAEKAIADRQTRMHQLIGIKAKVNAALAPHGILEALAEAIPLFRGVFIHKRVARLCSLAAQEPLMGELFEKEARHNDSAAWPLRADQLMQEAADELARMRDAEADEVRERGRQIGDADQRLVAAKNEHDRATKAVGQARLHRDDRLKLLNEKAGELAARSQDVQQAYDTLIVRAGSEFAVEAAKTRARPTLPTVADFDWLLDVTLRHMAFQKAMRYWEGRWIIEVQAVQEGLVNTKGGRLGTEARFRRWCMLTPCLVITLHSLPKHLRFRHVAVGKDGAWVSTFLFDFIDLLIVDEAGQVGPHIGAAAFALARQAVVVGDIYQIEPVSRVSRGADYANSARAGLRSMWLDGDPVSPHLISEPSDGGPQGSVMRLAQMATAASSPAMEKEPGIFLSEHRRCRSEIVEYCNRLVYKGRLEPLSAPRAKELPVRPLAWAHVRGIAKKVGGSNSNQLEANAIAGWIAGNADGWCQHYGKPIDEIVAVVTPFRPQSNLVREALRRVGSQFTKVTVGTVHSLQGAEKPIVVFSPTYSADTAKGMFFDRKPNMLNVAVSRAKDSFVVLGDMKLFRRKGRSPSAILGDMLFANEENELPDVDGNYRFPRELLVQGERISTLERHRDVLRKALAQVGAGQTVVIASPWITMKAVEDDGLVALVAAAVERGARVSLVVDRELSSRNPKHRASEAIAEMKKAGAAVSQVASLHNKTLISGPSEIIEGSFNWLSANRQRGDQFIRHETSWRISGDLATAAIRSALEEFEKLGAHSVQSTTRAIS
ncbi:MAG: AAA family ATPase [Rhodospirillaceae bacterium]|nr:AAA family ATPase [Rhodospirillales bacterium]